MHKKKIISIILVIVILEGLFTEKIMFIYASADQRNSSQNINENVLPVEIWDGETTTTPELIGYEYKIYSASELAWFAKEVNSGNSFDGKTIYISGNINLNGHDWFVIGLSDFDNPIEIKGNIVIQNALISGLYISENNGMCNGLFGSVLINDIFIDGLIMDDVEIFGSSYGGFLFGNIEISRNGNCVIQNSSLKGRASSDVSCGAIAGQFIGYGDNSQISLVNCKLSIESIEDYETWYGRKNSALKAGVIAKCYTQAKKCAIVMNGVTCDVSLKSIDEYGYHSSVAAGIIGILEGTSNVYLYQCQVDGNIYSKGYCGYAGGIIGKMIGCNIYKQSDCVVTASLESHWNAYGFPWVSAGFIGAITDMKPDGFIRNSYYAGKTETALAFISKDAVKGDKIKIYNSYYDKNLLVTSNVDERNVFHADNGCWEIRNTTINCNKYTTEQMGMQSNFVNWNFNDIWKMGDKYPKLRLENFELPDDFLVNEVGLEDSDIVKIVRQYASNEMYDEWEKIWNSEYSEDVKMEKIINLALNYGISDPREGLEFFVKAHEKAMAYNQLISDDMYTASNFLSWLDNGGRLLIGVDGLAFNGELKQWVNVSTYIKDEYPGIKKYKNMIYEYMDSTSNNIETWNDIKTVTKLAGNVTSLTEKTYVEEKINELNSVKSTGVKGTQERWKIIKEMDEKGVFINYKDGEGNLTVEKFLDKTSGFGQFANAMGIANNVIGMVDLAIDDINGYVLIDSKLQTYYQYKKMLEDIIESKDIVPYELWCAAVQVRSEIDQGYLNKIKETAEIILSASKINKQINNDVCEMLGISKITEWIDIVDMEAWFINQVVDFGKMVRQASYAEGYAQLANLYKIRLIKSKNDFVNSMTDENAWEFYYYYNMLYSMRVKGEQMYLEMHNVNGLAKSLFSKGYDMKAEVTKEILDNLENKCKFNLGENVEIPDSLKYVSKLIVSCSVNVKVYSKDGQLIKELKDGLVQDESNSYGRFIVNYNSCTNEYDKIIYLLNNDLKIEVFSYDDGLVNMTYSYLNEDDIAIVKYINNQPLLKNSNIIIYPNDVKSSGKVIANVDNETQEIELKNENNDYIKITDANLSDITLYLSVGESKLLSVDIFPINASVQNLTWESSDIEIASVKNGKVTAKKEGKATIYAFLHDKFTPIKCTIICDNTGPDVNINIGCYRWNTFDHNIKFRFFSKNTQTITITAFDNISENVKIEYYLAEKNMSKEELSSENTIWKEYKGEFDILANNKKIIYAKAVDESGNETIVNSEGIVIYTDTEVNNNEYVYIKNVSGDMLLDLKLNGNTIDKIKNGNITLKYGVDYIVNKDGDVILLKEYMDGLIANDVPYTFIINYNPFGEVYMSNKECDIPTETTIKLKVRKPRLVSIGKINDLIEVTNETDIKKIESYLDKEVAIITEDTTVTNAKIKWDLSVLENKLSDSTALMDQIIEVKGVIELPLVIDNIDNIHLDTKIKVHILVKDDKMNENLCFEKNDVEKQNIKVEYNNCDDITTTNDKHNINMLILLLIVSFNTILVMCFVYNKNDV